MITIDKLKSPWELIHKYEKSLKGFEKVKWRIKCFINDIHVWIVCLYCRLRFSKDK